MLKPSQSVSLSLKVPRQGLDHHQLCIAIDDGLVWIGPRDLDCIIRRRAICYDRHGEVLAEAAGVVENNDGAGVQAATEGVDGARGDEGDLRHDTIGCDCESLDVYLGGNEG